MKIIGKVPKDLEYIYISGPLTTGNISVNIREMSKVADKLMCSGFIPFNPANSFLQDFIAYKDYPFWLNYDLKVIDLFKFVLRIGGKSKGGDIEVKHAIKNKIPVVILEKREEIESFIAQYSRLFRKDK